MKPWLKRTLIGMFGASVLFGGLAACANRGWHGHGWHARNAEDAARLQARAADWVARELSLDEAQKAKLTLLIERLQAQREALVGRADPRTPFEAMVAGTTFDRAAAKALVDAKTAAVVRGSPELIAALADFYDSLRPEQQARVRELIAQRGRHHGWHG